MTTTLTRRHFTRAGLSSLGLTAFIPTTAWAIEPASIALTTDVSVKLDDQGMVVVTISTTNNEKTPVNLTVRHPYVRLVDVDGNPSQGLRLVATNDAERRMMRSRRGMRPTITLVDAGARRDVAVHTYALPEDFKLSKARPPMLSITARGHAQCGDRRVEIKLDQKLRLSA